MYDRRNSGLAMDVAVSSSFQDAQSTAMCALAAAMIVAYDSVVNVDREVELVWKKRWSLIKVVYLWHRYFGLLCVIFQVIVAFSSNLSDKVCSFWVHWEAWSYCALVFVSEAVLILWLWVAYNRRRHILVFLATLYAVEVAGVVTILASSLFSTKFHASSIHSFAVCRPDKVTDATSNIRLLWIPILVCDSILLTMFIYKGLYVYWSRSHRERFGVMYMVYKHTLPNFLAIVASYAICAVMWLTARPGLTHIPVSFALAFSITNCTRLLLNIRRAYYLGNETTQATQQSTFMTADGLHMPPRFTRGIRPEDSLDLERCEEIEVSVRVEVTRIIEEDYELADLTSLSL